MSKITGVLIFTTGFLGGFASAYFALKKRFDILMAEEVESVKQTYENFNTDNVKIDLSNVANTAKETSEKAIRNYEKDLPKDGAKFEPEFDEPYLIPPTEFNEVYGYETATLTLYSDGTIADEDMEIIDNPDEILGEENLQQLEDGETDCVYIRNDSKYCDYEVLRDYSTYEDAIIHQNSEEDYE